MENYTIRQPQINGILSDDYLHFEGIFRPTQVFMIRDTEIDGNSREVMEKYFNDIYNLFLRKISIFSSFEHSSDEEMIKIQALLQELVKVKKILQDLL